jgi:hypothetical protein
MGNLYALFLGLIELANKASPNIGIFFSKLLGIRNVSTSCSSQTFTFLVSKFITYTVTTLALGSQPRQGVARLQAKRGSPGMKESVKE